MNFFIEFREESERRLHSIASKTKDILKELAAEMNRRKKLSKVIFNLLMSAWSLLSPLG